MMNITDAKLAMERGLKVRHKYFSPHEWVTCGGMIYYIFEDGCMCSYEEFWSGRSDWIDGWSLFEDNK